MEKVIENLTVSRPTTILLFALKWLLAQVLHKMLMHSSTVADWTPAGPEQKIKGRKQDHACVGCNYLNA